MKVRWLVLSLCLIAASAAFAGTPPVGVEARLDPVKAAPGDTVTVTFHVRVPAGWHLYAPSAKEGVPVAAKLGAPAPGIQPGRLAALSGERELEIEGLGKVAVLEGKPELAWKLSVAKDASPGPRTLEVKLAYQACNESVCDMPREAAFSLPLEVEIPAAPVGPPVQLPKGAPAVANFSVEPRSLHPGETGRAVLDMFVAPGHHIYAPGSEGARVTQLDLELPPGFTRGPLDAPPPAKTEEDAVGKAVLWEGKVKIARPFTVPANAKPGKVAIKAHATWLVCDEKGCLPGDEEQALEVEIVPGAVVTGTGAGARAGTDSGTGVGLGALILAAISLGLANVLMPCTLPMIPVTISIFSKGKKLPRGESVFRASVYAIGIVLSFALMGGVIQVFFAGSGQGVIRTIANYGPLNLVIGALFVYFGLSFFGYYEIELPEFVRSFVQRSVEKAKEGAPSEEGVPVPALFLMGFFFVLTSYTCGAPLVLSLLSVGLATAGKASIVLATAIFGATTAAPFFVLALVPGLLKSLPRSGGWFKTFKVVLGVAELAAAMKFLSNADLYWHDGQAVLLPRNVFLGVWVIAGAFATLYVAHVIRFTHEEDSEPLPKLQPKAWLRALPFVLVTGYVAAALEGPKIPPDGPGVAHVRHKVAGYFESFLPPEPSAKDGTPRGVAHALRVYPSYEAALAAARKSGKPLFLEFTGHT